MVHTLPATVRHILGEEAIYKVAGSAGQQNFAWAETPWTSVFDRRVTETAQKGIAWPTSSAKMEQASR